MNTAEITELTPENLITHENGILMKLIFSTDREFGNKYCHLCSPNERHTHLVNKQQYLIDWN